MTLHAPQIQIGDLVELLSPKMERIGIVGIVISESIKVGFWDGDIECRNLSIMHTSQYDNSKMLSVVNEKYILRIE
jgi:hypothetical protein